MVENPPVMQEMQVDPWVRKTPSLEEGTENPLQYSCLENPMDRGYSHGVAKSYMTEQLTQTLFIEESSSLFFIFKIFIEFVTIIASVLCCFFCFLAVRYVGS